MSAALCVARVAGMPPRSPTLQGGEVHMRSATDFLLASLDYPEVVR